MSYDLLFAKLIRDYLDTADVDTGIPLPSVLPRFHMDDRAAGAVPALVVTAVIKERRKSSVGLELEIMLRTHPATEGDDAYNEALTWMGAVEAYMEDVDAWAAFLLTDAASAIPADIAIIERRIGAIQRIIDGKEGEHQRVLPVIYTLGIGL